MERVDALLELLASGYRARWVGGEADAEGVHSFPYVDYDPRVFDGLAAAIELAGGSDLHYLERIAPLKEIPPQEMSVDQLATWFTWVMRGERFTLGHIVWFIEDGSLEIALRRLTTLKAR